MRYANRLLSELACDDAVALEIPETHPALAWRRAGLMVITGFPDGPGLVCPAALASAADGSLRALKALVKDPNALPANGAQLLGERARLLGLRRNGRISANGSCRLLEMKDGRIALNLARPEDWELIPALLEGEEAADWPCLETAFLQREADWIVERGIGLGLPLALDQAVTVQPRIFSAMPQAIPRQRAPLVVELASLWAGPLAGSLLRMAGAQVVKVESLDRPDGARGGHAGFFDLLNACKRSIALDFAAPEGVAALNRLLQSADIVIEGSRPRALRQLGISREEHVQRGAVWVAITSHGQEEDRVGFGDDAAVAAGLAGIMKDGWGKAIFAGDAIADPLTGLHAALGAWAAWRSGGAQLIHLSLRNAVAHGAGAGIAIGSELQRWQELAEADEQALYPLRQAAAFARPLGADNNELIAQC